MCDGHQKRGQGWKGWIELPTPSPGMPLGPWVDLTYRLSPSTPRAGVFPQPAFRRLKSLPEDPLNVTEMQMVVHIGTHVDAPRHFFMDGPAFHEIPLDRLSGPGIVARIDDKPADGVISAEDLKRASPLLQRGDIVVVDTGWARHAGTEQYHDHPYLSTEAAEWLVDQGVKLVAFDVPTPDLPVNRRPAGYNWPAHHVLLSRGILISENVTGLDGLAGQRMEFVFLALNIEDSDGAPARVLARPIDHAAGAPR